MPNDRRGSSARGSGDSQYDWLYGAGAGRGRATEPPPSDDPEPTRMLPTMSRPGATRSPDGRGSVPEQPRRTPPPGRVYRSGHRPRRGGRRRVVLWVVALYLLFLVVVPAWSWTKVHKVAAFPSSGRPAAQPGETYLLVGSDSRRGLTAQQRRQMTTGNAAGARTDTIMLLHTGSGPNLLLSIPRDSLVPIPGYGTEKINAAFAYGGPKLLVQTVEQDTGVRIDHYVEIGFGPFVNLINAIGGINICSPKRINDKDSGLRVHKGCQQVDGIQGLAWARARHPFPTQDIARAEHQREVIGKMAGGIESPWTFVNPFRYWAVNNAWSQVTVDDQSSPYSVAMMGLAMLGSTKRCVMPLADLAVHWDRTRALELLNLIKTDHTSQVTNQLCTADGFVH